MLKSCSYCGRIVERNHICERKPKQFKKYNDKEKFRKSKAWQKKAEQIRTRDMNLCQICIRNLYSTINQYTYNDLSIHHAVPIETDYDKRLDDDNLITTCERHHELMESGKIPLIEVLSIIKEQNNTPGGMA